MAGDHGESLGEHGEAGHGMLVYDAALRVPLVLAATGLPAATRDEPVSLVDIFPTVLGLLGLAVPPAHDGRDLVAAGGGTASSEVYAETMYPEAAGCSPLRALVDRRWKYVGGPARPELYDLAQDPKESHDVAAEHPAIVDAMGPRAAAIAARAVTSVEAAPSAEVVERLRALGYVASAPAPRSSGDVAPSPVTMVREWSRFQDALGDLHGGEVERATATMAALVRERPDAPVFQATYARALADAGRTADALATYRAALRRWPQDTMLLHGLAVAARKAGRADEAMKAEQAVLAIDPADAAAHNGIGLLFARAGHPADARAAFERAVALDASAVSYWVNLGNARFTGGDTAAAEAAYREALRLDAASPDAANGLALLMVNTGRAASAIPLLERVLAASPDFYEAWLNLGDGAAGDGRRRAGGRRVSPRAHGAARHGRAAPGGGRAPRIDRGRRDARARPSPLTAAAGGATSPARAAQSEGLAAHDALPGHVVARLDDELVGPLRQALDRDADEPHQAAGRVGGDRRRRRLAHDRPVAATGSGSPPRLAGARCRGARRRRPRTGSTGRPLRGRRGAPRPRAAVDRRGPGRAERGRSGSGSRRAARRGRGPPGAARPTRSRRSPGRGPRGGSGPRRAAGRTRG